MECIQMVFSSFRWRLCFVFVLCERIQIHRCIRWMCVSVFACPRFAFLIYGHSLHYYAVFFASPPPLFFSFLVHIISLSRSCCDALFCFSIVSHTANSNTCPATISHLLICTISFARVCLFARCESKVWYKQRRWRERANAIYTACMIMQVLNV